MLNTLVYPIRMVAREIERQLKGPGNPADAAVRDLTSALELATAFLEDHVELMERAGGALAPLTAAISSLTIEAARLTADVAQLSLRLGALESRTPAPA